MSRISYANRSDFSFSIDKYHSLNSGDDIKKYVFDSLQKFNSNFLGQPSDRLRALSTNKDIIYFVQMLPSVLHQDFISVINEICNAICIIHIILKEIPYSTNYTPIYDLVVDLFWENSEPSSLFYKTISALYGSSDFCEKILMDGRFLSAIHGVLVSKNLVNLQNYLLVVSSSLLFKGFPNVDYISFIMGILGDLLTADLQPEYSSQILNVISKFVSSSMKVQSLVVTKLKEQGFFSIFNHILLTTNGPIIYSFYSEMLSSHFLHFEENLLLLGGLNSVYLSNSISDDTRSYILMSLSKEEKIWAPKLLSEFCLLNWYHVCILNNHECLISFVQIVNKVFYHQRSSINRLINTISRELIPIPNDTYIIEEVFSYLCSMIEDSQLSSIEFGDTEFLDTVFINPDPHTTATYILAFPSVRKLFQFLLSESRLTRFALELFTKLFEILFFDENGLILKIYINGLVKPSSYELFQFLLDRLNQPTIFNFFKQSILDRPSIILQLFSNFDWHTVVENNILTKDDYIISLLGCISLLAQQTGSHFFDEWVLKQPESSPLFNVDYRQFSSLIIPNQKYHEIMIPSLVYYLDDMPTDSFHNMYLIGLYGIPCALKLGLEVKYLESVSSVFLRPEDFLCIFEKNKYIGISMLKISSILSKIYELSPSKIPLWIELPDIENTIGFYIKFIGNSSECFQFLCIRGLSFSFCNSCIFDNNMKQISTIKDSEWNQIVISLNPSMNLIELYINGVLSYFSRDFQTSLSSFIGSMMTVPIIPYCVSSKIYTNCRIDLMKSLTYPLVAQGSLSTNISPSPGVHFVESNPASLLLANYDFSFYIYESLIKSRLFNETQQIFFYQHSLMTITKKSFPIFYDFLHEAIVSSMIDKAVDALTGFLGIVFELLETDQITSLISKLIFDVDVLEEYIVKESNILFEKLGSLLYHYINRVDFNALFRNGSISCIVFLYLMKKSHCIESLMGLIVKYSGSVLSEENLEIFCQIIGSLHVIYPMIVQNYSYNAQSFRSQNHGTQQQEFITFILSESLRKGYSYFSLDYLLYFSLVSEIESSKKILLLVLSVLEISKTTKFSISFLIRACQRFPFDSDIWESLLSLATGKSYSFSESMTQFCIENTIYFPVIFGMLVSVMISSSYENLQFSRILISIFVFLSKPFIHFLFSDLSLSLFIELICKEISDLDRIHLTRDIMSHIQYRAEDVKIGNIQDWINFSFLLSFKLKDKYEASSLQVISEFISQIFIILSTDETILSSFLSLLCNHGSKELIELSMSNFVQILCKSDGFNCFSSFSCFCLLCVKNRPTDLFRIILSGLIDLIDQRNDFYPYFQRFFIYSLDQMPDECFEMFGTLFTKIIQHKGLIYKADLLLFFLSMKRSGFVKGVFLTEVLGYLYSKALSNDIGQFEIEFLGQQLPIEQLLQNVNYFKTYDIEVNSIIQQINNVINEWGCIKISNTLEKSLVSSFISEANQIYTYSQSFCTSLFDRMNFWIRAKEQNASNIIRMIFKNQGQIFDKRVTNSYHKSFTSQYLYNISVFPSPFQLEFDNNTEKHHYFKDNVYGLKAISNGYKYNKCFPDLLTKYCFHLNPKNSSITQMIMGIYGNYLSISNGRIVRLNINCQCVLLFFNDYFLVYLGTKLENGDILIDTFHEPQCNYLYESLLLNEFGHFSIFCGRPIIRVKHKHIYSVLSRSVHQNEFEIRTVKAGMFILKSESQFPQFFIYLDSTITKDLSQIVEKWITGSISNFTFLSLINYFALRSECDSGSYPVFPRVLMSFKGESLDQDLATTRSLHFPIPIVADTDNSIKVAINRFSIMKCHFTENVSNPSNVSLFNIRLSPFTYIQREIHNGWDAGDRCFYSIPFHMGVSSKTSTEFPPEMFSIPEVFINMNSIVISPANDFSIEYPKWAKNAADFIEKHRYALEAPKIRSTLSSWVDLIFGYKQTGIEAESSFNVFYPLSYNVYDSNMGLDSKQEEWARECGQIPKQLFTQPVPIPPPCPLLCLDSISIKSNAIIGSKNIFIDTVHYLEPNTLKGIVSIRSNQTSKRVFIQYVPSFVHCNKPKKSSYFAITSKLSEVIVYRIMKDHSEKPVIIEKQAKFFWKSPLFSVLCTKESICVTGCISEVVLWSFITGMMIKRIEIKSPSCIELDEETNSLFVASKNVLYHYTLMGIFIRQVTLPSNITSISAFGFGFSIYDRVIVTGHSDGVIRLHKILLNTDGFLTILEEKVSKSPIMFLSTQQNSHRIEFCDLATHNQSIKN